MQSWEDTTATGREHGVPVARRGHNVGYGMMLMQPDGTLTEPSRAHTRRGQRLGDGFRVADVEEAMARNAELQRGSEAGQEPVNPAQSLQDWLGSAEYEAEFERLRREWEQEKLDAAPQRHRPRPQSTAKTTQEQVSMQPPLTEGQPPSFKSKLREGRRAKISESMQRRLDGLAALEEDYRDAGYQPDAAFVARIRASGGLGRPTPEKISSRLKPGLREQLELYVDKAELKDHSYNADQRLEEAIRRDEKGYPPVRTSRRTARRPGRATARARLPPGPPPSAGARARLRDPGEGHSRGESREDPAAALARRDAIREPGGQWPQQAGGRGPRIRDVKRGEAVMSNLAQRFHDGDLSLTRKGDHDLGK